MLRACAGCWGTPDRDGARCHRRAARGTGRGGDRDRPETLERCLRCGSAAQVKDRDLVLLTACRSSGDAPGCCGQAPVGGRPELRLRGRVVDRARSTDRGVAVRADQPDRVVGDVAERSPRPSRGGRYRPRLRLAHVNKAVPAYDEQLVDDSTGSGDASRARAGFLAARCSAWQERRCSTTDCREPRPRIPCRHSAYIHGVGNSAAPVGTRDHARDAWPAVRSGFCARIDICGNRQLRHLGVCKSPLRGSIPVPASPDATAGADVREGEPPHGRLRSAPRRSCGP